MSRPLRIWLPAICAGSGADVFVQRLAQGLQRAGHEPQVQWFDHRYELMPWRLTAYHAPAGTDLVHANSWQGFAFKREGIPLVVTEHQYVAHPTFAPYEGYLQRLYHRRFIEPCMRKSFRAAAAVVAVSEFCAAAMREDLNKPVEVVHNWVDTFQFSPGTRGIHGVGADNVTRLLFVGNPSRWKGADILPALASILGEGYEIHCLGGLRKGFKRGKLPRNMRLLSSMASEAMPDIYRSVDMALVPTRYEAFGYVALEAMSCGLPVVGFDSSGTAEICVHGETSLLASVDDVKQLADHIKQLACDPKSRSQLGAAGRQRALEYFGEERAVAAYLHIYSGVLKKGRA